MYLDNFAKTALVIFHAMTLSTTVLSNSANAQGLGFVDLNQSRQFFHEGNDRLQGEVEQWEENQKIPEIQLPENYIEPQDMSDANSTYKKQKIKSTGSLTIADYYYIDYSTVTLSFYYSRSRSMDGV